MNDFLIAGGARIPALEFISLALITHITGSIILQIFHIVLVKVGGLNIIFHTLPYYLCKYLSIQIGLPDEHCKQRTI